MRQTRNQKKNIKNDTIVHIASRLENMKKKQKQQKHEMSKKR